MSAPREWWESHFDRHYLLEYEPLFTLERDRAEAARLIDVLALPVGARVLDVPCGQGRHAHLLAEAGFDVTGLDYSPTLLTAARRRGTGASLRYVRGDMRTLPAKWTGRLRRRGQSLHVIRLLPNPADDARVLSEFARVLKPGGVLIWHGGSRDGVMARFLSRDWWKTEDGTMIAHERTFDPLSGVLSRGRRVAGPPGARPSGAIAFGCTRRADLAELGVAAGLVVEHAFDGWSDRPLTRRSSRDAAGRAED